MFISPDLINATKLIANYVLQTAKDVIQESLNVFEGCSGIKRFADGCDSF